MSWCNNQKNKGVSKQIKIIINKNYYSLLKKKNNNKLINKKIKTILPPSLLTILHFPNNLSSTYHTIPTKGNINKKCGLRKHKCLSGFTSSDLS